MFNPIPHIVLWAVLATVVAFLGLYRRKIRMKSDEVLHVLDQDASLVPEQEAVAKRLEKVDRWGKWLTAVVIVYAVLIGAMYLYSVFQDTSVKMN